MGDSIWINRGRTQPHTSDREQRATRLFPQFRFLKFRRFEPKPGFVSAGSMVDEIARLRHLIETQRLMNVVSFDRDELMRVVTERAQAITSADGGIVELVEGDEMAYRAVSGAAAGSIGSRLEVTGSLSGRCVRLGVPMRCGDTEIDTRVDTAACLKLGIRSMVIVPLMQGEFPVGVLKVVSAQSDHFDDADVEILQEMAGFLADSIANASARVPEAQAALHDPLTGLANRHLLMECLDRACVRADRNHTPIAVFLVGLDGFKQVNDRYGHAAGDEALRLVGRRLAETVRAGDVLGRLGGDEFVVVCDDADESDAEGIIARMSAAVRQVADSAPRFGRLSASVGMAWRGAEHRSPDELLSAADTAMCRSKVAGRPGAPSNCDVRAESEPGPGIREE